MSRIHQLDTSVINKIAAGEVIERPANVVKELIENSVDAMATRIEVDIVDGGAQLIRITDDGEGIHPNDILLAVSSHATSKIVTAEDLFFIQTMGFRGEALASIAEVSHINIRTRQTDAVAGVELDVNCGERSEVVPCGCPTGTRIEIRNLFASTPVRRKFLKTKSTEFGHISDQFTRVALANSRLRMTLRHNDKVVFDLPASDGLSDRLRMFYGKSLTDHLVWVESEVGDVRMSGYVAHPSQSKSARKWQHLFLNGRWFQDRSIQHALTESYRGLLMVGRQPISFLFIDMPPSAFDVNVHPTKAEVRFVDGQHLYRQMLSMIRTKFLTMDLDSEMQLDGGRGTESETHGDPVGATVVPQQKLQAELEAWATGSGAAPTRNQNVDSTAPITTWSVMQSQADLARMLAEPQSRAIDSTGRGTAVAAALAETVEAADEMCAAREGDSNFGQQSEIAGSVAGETPLTGEEEQRETIDKPAPAVGDQSGERAMQIMDCYLVVEAEQGMMIIDQHALHERIMYEYLRPRVLNGSVESQRMLIPETIDLTAREASLVVEHAEVLGQIGIGVDEFGTNTVIVNKWPVMMKKARPSEMIRDIAEQLESQEKRPTRRDALDELLHMMSCKAAIKSGQRLKPEEIDSLLAQRHLCDDAHHCPHGRPTALVLSQVELDKQFGRLG
ncbi:MAG: DNA mismatch repair endonuclease MutL [Planctomycetaceae bacterium]|nr:DNA mismatch repair endonuclease MutL [Planctomycetaceae bacterium]